MQDVVGEGPAGRNVAGDTLQAPWFQPFRERSCQASMGWICGGRCGPRGKVCAECGIRRPLARLLRSHGRHGEPPLRVTLTAGQLQENRNGDPQIHRAASLGARGPAWIVGQGPGMSWGTTARVSPPYTLAHEVRGHSACLRNLHPDCSC